MESLLNKKLTKKQKTKNKNYYPPFVPTGFRHYPEAEDKKSNTKINFINISTAPTTTINLII